MKEGAIDCERAIVTHHQATEVAEPGVSVFGRSNAAGNVSARDHLASPVSSGSSNAGQSVQCLVVPTAHATHHCRRPCRRSPARALLRPTRMMTPTYADRRERGFREPDFRRGGRVKVVSQRKTAAVDHHHPPRPLAPLGFSDSAAPFFAGAKLPSRNDSLHFRCWRSFNSLRNDRQTFIHTPCSSQSRSRRQQVEGCGYSSGKSCSEHRSAESTESLPGHGGCPSTGGHHGDSCAVSGARARFSSAAIRSATDQTAPSALPWRC
jgi:hypothetical protein